MKPVEELKPKESNVPGLSSRILRGSVQVIGTLLIVIVTLMILRWLFVEPYVIPSRSMQPNLLVNDHILVNKISYGLRVPFSKIWIWQWNMPSRGDIVVFRSPKDDQIFMVKRVVGLPGDLLRMDDTGALSINGRLVSRAAGRLSKYQSFLDDSLTEKDLGLELSQFDLAVESLSSKDHMVFWLRNEIHIGIENFRVPEGHIFVLGDHRDLSRDSRFWGALPVDHLIGRAFMVWLSCQDTLSFASYLCDPKSIRRDRLFFSL